MKTKLLLILLLAALSLQAQKTEKRIALVIGNAAYPKAALNNPVNDAKLMERTLKQLGFTVLKTTNATKYQMQQAIDKFKMKLPEYNVALFYYAGHGMEINGRNYIIPTDAQNTNENAVRIGSIDVGHVVQEFENYSNNVNIVILDACRDNPFISNARGGNRGFSVLPAPSGTLIAYATAPGKTASDGTGKNGLYTKILAEEMLKPNRLLDVFMNTRNRVNQSNRNQNPQEWTQLKAPFYFAENSHPVKPVAHVKKTVVENKTGSFTDPRDGKVYKTVRIGEQVWMAENLDYPSGKYISESEEWKNLGNSDAAWCFYNNDDTFKEKYGLLYTWKAAKKACPDEWRLPTKNDFERLLKNVGANSNNAYYSLIEPDRWGTSGIFGGFRSGMGKFMHVNNVGGWWSSVLVTKFIPYRLDIDNVFEKVKIGMNGKSCGFSVRCIKDK